MHITKEEKVIGIYQKFKDDFQEFAFNNKIVVSATGFVFGLATKDFIEKVLNNIILPLINKSSRFMLLHGLAKNLKSYTGLIKIFGGLLWDIFMWFITIILTFVILEYFFNRTFLGLQTKLTDTTKKEFVEAKESAKHSIIPDDKELKEIVKDKKIEAVQDKKNTNHETSTNKTETFNDSYNNNDNMHMIGSSFTLL